MATTRRPQPTQQPAGLTPGPASPGGRSLRDGDRFSFRVTERDLQLLEFVAAHRFVLACQVSQHLGASDVVAYRRLKGLCASGLLSYRQIFHARPGCYLATAIGLAAIESPLPRATVDLRTYRHDLGVVWLHLDALRDSFGPARRVLAEREMRSHDQRAQHGDASFAIPLGGYGPGGRERVHYPDVLLLRPDHSRIGLELELTLKSRGRLEAILAGYAAEPRIAHVLYLTDRPAICAAVHEIACEFGLDARLRVQYLEPAPDRRSERAWQSTTQKATPPR